MRVVSLINQKGGVGKSTIALSLAAASQIAGTLTVLLDLDPQASATEWYDARSSNLPAVESIQPARLKRVLDEVRDKGAGLLVLDTAPHAEATALEAARYSDLVLVPVSPSIMDLRAMRKTVDLLTLAKARAYAVLNAVPSYGTEGDEAAETITNDLGLPVAPVRLGDRVAYKRCLISGQTVQEFEPGGKAAIEVAALHTWVGEQISRSSRPKGTKAA